MRGLRNIASFTFRFNHLCLVLLLKSTSMSLPHRIKRPTNRFFDRLCRLIFSNFSLQRLQNQLLDARYDRDVSCGSVLAAQVLSSDLNFPAVLGPLRCGHPNGRPEQQNLPCFCWTPLHLRSAAACWTKHFSMTERLGSCN